VPSASHAIKFIPNPLQKKFIESKAKADLFSSRMGEGKSAALAWSTLYHTRHNPKAEWALIRDTWENMQATTMKTFFEWFPPGIAGTFHATKKVFTWASGLADGNVQFLGMDDPQDASKLMSRELAGFGIDEPAPAIGSAGVDELIFTIGLSRLRQPGMKWYGAKLAENNPDENHWTYKQFVKQPKDGFVVWQPTAPENVSHLPADYYENLRKTFSHRPDLVRRFVDGDFGFQSIGKAVTPQWNDKLHLATGLAVLPRRQVYVLWDFGHNPTAILTQVTPMGQWLILDALVGENQGVEELIIDEARPLINTRYVNNPLMHIGDPQGNQREQTSVARTAVQYIKKELGGTWRNGPVATHLRIDPLQAVLSRQISGRGLVQVDRERANKVWQSLRGGWHYHIARSGLIGTEPVKNEHSHPGDAMGYGAAILYPLGAGKKNTNIKEPRQAGYDNRGETRHPLQFGPGASRIPPKHGSNFK
jgi:hypothetical protein